MYGYCMGCHNCGYTTRENYNICPLCGKNLASLSDAREIANQDQKQKDWKTFQELKRKFNQN